jgi:UDP-N-acetyl-D-glucosamine dehydrogenase
MSPPLPSPALPERAARLAERFTRRTARIGVVGLGYVGLPLIGAFVEAGFDCVGFDVDAEKVSLLNQGRSYIHHISDEALGRLVATGRFFATVDIGALTDVDAILICVPTPLDRHRAPDLSYVRATGAALAEILRPGQLVVLESTSYPGTTSEELKPILETGGLRAGVDFYLAFSPEREDPGNRDFKVGAIPKVVGGDEPETTFITCALYDTIVPRTVPVRSSKTAEAVKLTENIFRSVNIALVNELKILFAKMDIDIWEVIEAAKTKPFGYMAFYPGPGIGGHCIPIAPVYMAWKAREHHLHARFIELAAEINEAMPDYVIGVVMDALNAHSGRGLKQSRILVMGAAYKKNVDDMRESVSLVLMERLIERGAQVDYFDPYVPVIPETRENPSLAGMRSIAWEPDRLSGYDAVVISTDHDSIDYQDLVDRSRLVIDTRNATRAVLRRENIVRA